MSSFVGERLTKGLSFVAENAEKIHQKEFLRTEVEREYASLEDFTRIDPAAKRLVVIGCTGAGKSTLLNVMAGHKFEQSEETDMEFVWDKTPLFESKAGGDSVTKKTSFANLHWFGDAHRTFTAIDTPGHDDPGGADISEQAARDVLSELAADLHNKIKATGHVHAILVLHNDVASNRLNPATCVCGRAVGGGRGGAGATARAAPRERAPAAARERGRERKRERERERES